MVKKHLSYITFLQSFAVTLVVLGHSFPLDKITNEIPLIFKHIHDILYSFHMPLFFAIAGFLFIYSMENNAHNVNFKEFLYKKVKRLIIPYFTIGTFAFCLKTFIFNSFAYRPSQPSLSFYVSSMLAPNNNPDKYLWFLPVIFGIFIIAFFTKKINIIKMFVFSFITLFFIKYLPLHFLKIVLYNLFYFIFGGLIYTYRQTYFKNFSNLYLLFASFILFLVFDLFLTNYILIKVLVALLGIIISFRLAIFCDNKKQKFLFGLLDGKYYQIYLLSWFAQTGIRIFYQLNIVNYETIVILMLIGGIVFPLILCALIERYIPRLKIFIGM